MFSCWGVGNEETKMNMRVGGCYYLDIRKPHAAVNKGSEVRTHLVVDVVSTPKIRELLSQQKKGGKDEKDILKIGLKNLSESNKELEKVFIE